MSKVHGGHGTPHPIRKVETGEPTLASLTQIVADIPFLYHGLSGLIFRQYARPQSRKPALPIPLCGACPAGVCRALPPGNAAVAVLVVALHREFYFCAFGTFISRQYYLPIRSLKPALPIPLCGACPASVSLCPPGTRQLLFLHPCGPLPRPLACLPKSLAYVPSHRSVCTMPPSKPLFRRLSRQQGMPLATGNSTSRAVATTFAYPASDIRSSRVPRSAGQVCHCS
jgi:hypothetical protein